MSKQRGISMELFFQDQILYMEVKRSPMTESLILLVSLAVHSGPSALVSTD